MAAFMLRVIFILETKATPAFSTLLGDALSYYTWAEEIANGNILGDKIFYQAPLYPYFLAVLIKTVGSDIFWIRILQAALSAISCVILAISGENLFSKRIGVIAGFFLALYPPAIFFSYMIQKATLSIFFLTLMLLFSSLVIIQKQHIKWWYLLGCSLGGLSLLRENTLIFIPVYLIWFFFHFNKESKINVFMRTFFFTAGIATFLIPVAARNFYVGGDFVLTTSQFGSNLYIGNSEKSDGFYKPLRPSRGNYKFESLDARELAEEASGRTLSPEEISEFWFKKTLDYIKSNPVKWIRLLFKKLWLTVNRIEIMDSESQYAFENWSFVLKILKYFHFGVVFPIAMLGIIISFFEKERIWLLYFLLTSLTLSIALFFIFARYRLPLIPILFLFSAIAVYHLWQLIRQKKYKHLIAPLAIMVLFAIPCNIGHTSTSQMVSHTLFNIGKYIKYHGNIQDAVSYFQDAINYYGDYADAHYELGRISKDQGGLDTAFFHFRKTIDIAPDFADAQNEMGLIFLQQGKFQEATFCLLSAVNNNPDHPAANFNLGTVYYDRRKYPDAIRHFNKTITIDPDNADAHYGLGISYAALGNLEQAVYYLRKAIKIQPDYPQAAYQLNAILKTMESSQTGK